MVSDELQSGCNKTFQNQHLCGDGTDTKIIANLNDSSSDKSLKIESTPETSANDESDGTGYQNLNRTYSCEKIDETYNAGDADPKEDKIDEFSVTEIFDDVSQNTIWKHRNFFSIANGFESIKWSEISNLNIENLTFEESKTDESENDSMLVKIRNYLAEYQELRGMSQGDHTYSNLLKIMSQATGRCLLALFYVMINIAPVLEIFLHIMRFVFDAMIDLKNTTDTQQIAVKTALFFVQLLSICICLTIIFGFIVSPVIRMAFGIITKIMFYD